MPFKGPRKLKNIIPQTFYFCPKNNEISIKSAF